LIGNSLFWSRLHGGATHFPIGLIFGAAFFDLLAFFSPRSSRRYDFGALGYWLVLLGALGAFGAVFSGLVLSKWTIAGTGLILLHHLFVWPAFALIVGLATWRCAAGHDPSRRGFATYLVLMVIACALIGAAGFFGGEMLLGQ
jgi:uncharacterized membrane protein